MPEDVVRFEAWLEIVNGRLITGLTEDKFEMNVNVSTKAVQDTLDGLYHLLNDVDDLGNGKYDGIPMCISSDSLKHINQYMDDLYSMFNLEPPKIDDPF